MLFEGAVSPLVYVLLLAGGVGLGLPMGPVVVGAGALYGGVTGLVVVVIAQGAGLTINWHVCRHWCRDWIRRRFQSRRRWQWMLTVSNTCLPWPTLVLLRLALLPMTMVNAMCALSATRWQPYAFTSLAMVLRFAVMVQVGALGVEAGTGHFNRVSAALTMVAAAATFALAWLSGIRLRRLMTQPKSDRQSDPDSLPIAYLDQPGAITTEIDAFIKNMS